MARLEISRDQILTAMDHFDKEFRASSEWRNWEQSQVHKFAIEHESSIYPVKMIVSLASGVPVAKFSGGRAPGDANQIIERNGFKVIVLNRTSQSGRFWWVNHKQTIRHEVGGGFLWSPFVERNGAKSQFYDNMRVVAPGEPILSLANAQVGHIGIALSDARPFARPAEFGVSGDAWANEGWLLPVKWYPINNPVRPKDHSEAFGRLLPSKYSPIRRTGDGNQKAYLTEVSRELFELTLGLGSSVLPTRAEIEPLIFEGEFTEEFFEDPLKDIPLSETERKNVALARRGQGQFRRNLAKVETKCRVTGVRDQRLLIAGHIKPWASCTTAQERLDGNNGLFLTPTADKLFDGGHITFSPEGEVILADWLSIRLLTELGLPNLHEGNVGQFNSHQKAFLEYHNKRVFKSEIK